MSADTKRLPTLLNLVNEAIKREDALLSSWQTWHQGAPRASYPRMPVYDHLEAMAAGLKEKQEIGHAR